MNTVSILPHGIYHVATIHVKMIKICVFVSGVIYAVVFKMEFSLSNTTL